jgi:serine protease Do
MMEGIMSDPRVETALATKEAVPAMKAFPMLIPVMCRTHATMLTAAFLLGFGLVATGCTQGDWVSAAASAGAPVPSFAPVVQQVLPAVVNVSAIQRVHKAAADADNSATGRAKNQVVLHNLPPAAEELLRRFSHPRDLRAGSDPKVARVALGSGFVIDPNGYVVTDDHVVEDAEKVTIITQDTIEYSARIVGRDPLTDLALLKIETERPLAYVHWGDSDTARVGDWVLAIGNPFGLDNTVSSGIISGRGRDIHSGPYDDFLQIDAAMNRGNSGGPTFNLHGDVIGINTAIYSPNGGSVGIGFAIPANRAKPVVEQLQAHGRVARGWLGIHIQQVTPELVRSLGMPSAVGALVAKVGAGTPAATAGFVQGDVILSINGLDIRRLRDLPLAVAEAPIGQTATVTVWRQNAALTLRPVISEMPTNPEVAELRHGGNDAGRPERTVTRPSPASASYLMI